MTKEEFRNILDKDFFNETNEIATYATHLHDTVCNQKYGDKPYSVHLFRVEMMVRDYGYLVCENKEDALVMFFAAYFHDAIEDARQTYNDILKIARKYLPSEAALLATEIVYALTDEKGRTRQERASDKHFEDIRDTKYAPFIKWCDRFANLEYSIEHESRMAELYKKEMPSFIERLGGEKYLPKELIDEINNL